jgi:hypothetical protein
LDRELPVLHYLRHLRPFRLALSSAPVVAACGGSTEPAPRTEPDPNTIVAEIAGAVEFSGTGQALGGHYYVVGQQDQGVHLQGVLGGHSLVIHLPGLPVAGTHALGRWDLARDYVRRDSIMNVGRKPSIAFGDRAVAALDHYTSLEGGTLEIDAITPPLRGKWFDRGEVRGRLQMRAAADSVLLPPGTLFVRDTVEVIAEFRIELENWPDGRARLTAFTGPLAGTVLPSMLGGASVWVVNGKPDTLLLLGVADTLPTGEQLRFWVATTLGAPGAQALQALTFEQAIDPPTWPDHFIGGLLDGRPIASVSGTIRLDSYSRYFFNDWGETKGSVSAIVAIRRPDGPEVDHVAIDLQFHVPVGFFVAFGFPPELRRPGGPELRFLPEGTGQSFLRVDLGGANGRAEHGTKLTAPAP